MATLPNPNPTPTPDPSPNPKPDPNPPFPSPPDPADPIPPAPNLKRLTGSFKEPTTRLIARGALLVALTGTPALAADGFYIVKEEGSTTCTVVDVKPTDGKTVLVDAVIYTSELEAKDAITKIEACQNN